MLRRKILTEGGVPTPRFDTAIFDVDGTLLDTTEGIVSSVSYTVKHHGLKGLSEEQLLTFIGPPIQDSFAARYGITDREYLQQLATTFRDRYKGDDLIKARAYDGIYDVCAALRENGVRIAVATYKREDYAVRIMQHFGFDRYADVIHGADHENRLKKSDIIEMCLKECGITDDRRSRAVMIGDSENDAAGAAKAGIPFIGVTYGFGFKSREETAERGFAGTADDPRGILDIIL